MQNKLKSLKLQTFLIPLVCLTLGGFSNNAISWGHDGHTAIGILAVNQLQPEALRQLEGIVNPLTTTAMAEACNWPDVIRETEEGEWSSPLHYINIPRNSDVYMASRDCPESPDSATRADRPARYCATEAIKHFASGLSDQNANTEQRWQAFAWLCHLVGDLHQPLHAGFADDRGGNDVDVIFNEEPMNLHHFWDTALIGQRAGSWQHLVGWLGEFPPVTARSGWLPEVTNDWTSESHELAGKSAYPGRKHINICFADETWEIAQRQIKKAASRLALIINSELTTTD